MTTEIDPTFHGITRLPAGPARGAATMVIATRHEIAGAGIEALLRASGHIVVACCPHEDDLLPCLEAHCPDIAILDECILGQDSAKTISRLRARNRTAIIFLLEESDAIKVAGLLDVHVEGILLSRAGARRLIDCVESVSQGQTWVDPELVHHLAKAERCHQIVGKLTSRESDIAQLVTRGLCNKAIARELHLSEGTVKMHLHHIYEKLRLGGRTQLALSTAGASARMPGYEVCPTGESSRPDSAVALRFVAWRPPKNPDNAPGHIVAISLSGIKSGSTYTFQVRDLQYAPGANGEVDAYTPFIVTDGGQGDLDGNANGQIVTTWTVHDQDLVTLSLTATGNDGTVVSTTFADALGRSLSRPGFSNRSDPPPARRAVAAWMRKGRQPKNLA
jgi:DNA-binding NarL/FixJ family response regulator